MLPITMVDKGRKCISISNREIGQKKEEIERIESSVKKQTQTIGGKSIPCFEAKDQCSLV